MSKTNPELWRDMKEFKRKVPVDIYEYEAPKYGKDPYGFKINSWISWLLPVGIVMFFTSWYTI